MAFIGDGAMGEVMVKYLLTARVAKPQDMEVSDISPTRRDLLSKEYRVGNLSDNRRAVANAELIILAGKPHNLPQVM